MTHSRRERPSVSTHDDLYSGTARLSAAPQSLILSAISVEITHHVCQNRIAYIVKLNGKLQNSLALFPIDNDNRRCNLTVFVIVWLGIALILNLIFPLPTKPVYPRAIL